MKIQRLYTLCLCLLLMGRLSSADYPAPAYLGIEQGLSNNSVRCIYQDHRGFMWFGTYDGLSRYDGYGFKVFRNRLGDSSSLPHNYIYTICEDRHNRLWVGTGQGIGVYHPLREKFFPAYYIPYGSTIKEKITRNINAIREDAKGNIFIGSNGGGLLVQYAGAQAAVQLPFSKIDHPTGDYNVTDILIDRQQQVWLFIQDVGLCRFDYAAKKIRLVNGAVKGANCLVEDGRQMIWIGTSNGLFRYDPASAGFTKQYTEQQGGLTENKISGLAFDRQHRLWIGTNGGGINILDPATGGIQSILPGQGSQSITSESVYAVYHDAEDRTWIGTLKGGINIFDPRKSRFQTIAHDPLNRNSLVNNFASCFWEDSDKNLWIGTDGGGFSIWNRMQGSFRHFVHEGTNNRSLSNNMVTSILQGSDKNYWIATYGGGINKYNPATGFEHYPCINQVTGEENKNVWLLYEDSRKNLWATTFSRGRLYLLDRSANTFKAFDQTLTDLISFTEDNQGTLWAGNSHQLIRIDPVRGQHVYYEIGKPVRAICEDAKRNFWLGTEGGGLIRFNRQQGKIVARYSDADGLCNNAVLNIVEDGKGVLWLSTFNGLSEFTSGKGFKNFYQSDGLQSNQFLYNAAARLLSGELVFGGIKGFTLFHPDSLHPIEKAPAVWITGLRINNKAVTPDNPYVTRLGGDRIEALRIPYDEAVLQFDWAALEYSTPDKISYAYYLEDWDKGWNWVQGARSASYTHLKEGRYILHIKATNAGGTWNGRETTVQITVLPPWYRTGWAYLFYLCAAAGLMGLYLRYRTQQTKLAYEVKLARLTAEKEKELNEKKLAFFTDISHEFRTPITLIIGPLKDMLQANKKPDTGALHGVYRNASRLLSLVDQLLQFQKAGAGGDRLAISRLDIVGLCRDVYESFGKLAASKRIDYQFICHANSLELYADREKMEIVLFNLLSNAMKFTPEGGRVVFSVEEEAGNVELSVADNGPGIPAGVGDKLFERFYRVSEAGSAAPGFGIGLYLAKHFVDKHAGTIRYQSEPGQGTTFYVSIPKGRAHVGEGVTYVEEAKPEPEVQPPVVEQALLPIPEKTAAPQPVIAELEELVNSKASMLVVEDNPEIRAYIKSMFTDFTLYEAETGQAGIQVAQEHEPDIIISDIMMPNGSGIELCKAVKGDAALSHIPVILLTALSASDMKLQGLECGADDYITKPFEKELLVARVVNLLKKRTLLQHYFYNEITLQQNGQKISEAYKAFLERCIAIVEAHLDDDQFGIKQLAREIGMSHSNLYKKVKSISGQSVNAFIRFIRLRKAAELLINTGINVNETAFEVGIKDARYFREQFNKLFGMNPSDYIKKYRKPFSPSYRVNREVFKNQERNGS